MRKQIQKSFNECFPKNQKISNKQTQSASRSCNAPKTRSFADAIEKENDAVALSDSDRFLFQNLRSFYRKECEEEMAKIGEEASLQFTPPRFINTPRRSSRVLIVEKACSSSASPIGDSSTTEKAEEINSSAGDDFIAILTCSRSPYEDFRRSMQEMVAARLERNGEVDREFMEELLFRYLDLNNEKFYGCIVRAFLDLIVISREDSGRVPGFLARRRPWVGGGGRRKLKLEIKRMRKFYHK